MPQSHQTRQAVIPIFLCLSGTSAGNSVFWERIGENTSPTNNHTWKERKRFRNKMLVPEDVLSCFRLSCLIVMICLVVSKHVSHCLQYHTVRSTPPCISLTYKYLLPFLVYKQRTRPMPHAVSSIQ